ncbi:hypothetical protein [Actinomadura decatromicini]|uniref:Uncharacterized protein n=1 Tax=Actinomadura decatromicini TaxID=2604572 RepID=A0A5D3FAF4_9ACTN|nr:hypothetical protein [Actinomadura decatromicini]TYK45193.1 hypothetical protein FXF68_31440 [Actinomadura decatromicini]
MSAPEPRTGTCHRCGQTRPLFRADPKWGETPVWLCSPDWQVFAEARANGTFVDWDDAFDNATDEQMNEALDGRVPGGGLARGGAVA